MGLEACPEPTQVSASQGSVISVWEEKSVQGAKTTRTGMEENGNLKKIITSENEPIFDADLFWFV